MNLRFDELARGLAQSVTRPGALNSFGAGRRGIRSRMILGLALPLFVSALALPGSLLGQVQPQQVWSATAGGTGAIPKAMALDASGNIVVAGYDAGDYLTAKFDSNGNLLWSARENGRVGDIALAPGVTAVALDAAGNVYVTGGLGGSRSYTVTYCFFTCTTYHLNASDQVTVKYSSNGHRQWISTYYEPGDNSFYGNAIAVDGSGNAYVTGTKTVKYDPKGNQLWLKTNVSASALVLDSSTNVYVGDTSTLKFGQDGTLLWSQPVNGQILKLDGTGNLYASGKTYQGPTTKLDRNGGVLWTAPFGGLSALGNSGNVYLASAVLIPPGAGYFHNATVKLNNQGGLVWQAINDRGYSGASVSGVALDANENVYLAGYDNNTPTSWKYDPDGLRIWQNDLASGPYSPLLAFDSSGNLYLAVNFGGLQLTKYTQVAAPGAPVIAPPPQHPLVRPGDNVTLAVNATGNAPLNYQWRTLLGLIPDGTNATLLLTNVQSSQAGMYSVAVTNALGSAASPEIYVSVLNPLASQTAVLGATATFFTPLAGGGPAAYQWQFNGANLSGQTRATLAVTNIGPGQAGGYTVVVSNYYGNVLTSTVAQLQVDSHATQAWADIVPGGNVGDVVQAVGVDPLGNVFVTGYSDCGHKTVKYNAAGQELWEACDTNYGTLAGLVVDASGNVCVAGGSFAWKYSPSGNLLWTSHFDDGAGSTNDVTGAMAIDSAGSFYIAGTSASGSNGTDIITAKYSPGGRQIWAARYDGPAHGDDFPESIVVDNAGNVYAGGASLGTNDYDFAVLKYDPNGNLVWARSYNGPGNGADVAARIAVDSSGEVYVTGWSPGDDYITDFATIKYDASGAQLWVARYAGPGNGQDNPHGLAVDTGGNVYVTGSSFGADGFYDIATVKYAPDGTELWVRRYSGPANGNDYSRALALDSAGNVYVEGHSDSGPGSGPSARSTEVVTLSYDSGGTQRWAARYETGIESGNYYRNGSMTVERGGTVYVADTTFTSGSPAFLTLKYVQPIPIRLGLPVISSNGQLRCVLTGEPGALYTIQFSTDLVSWNLLTNVLTTAAGTTEFTDSIAPGPGTKFYRALQP